VRIFRRERERRRTAETVVGRRLVEDDDLTGHAIVPAEHVIPALRVHVSLVERVGDQESILKAASRIPVVRPNLAEVAAAEDTRRT
jgi:hypothetical protein